MQTPSSPPSLEDNSLFPKSLLIASTETSIVDLICGYVADKGIEIVTKGSTNECIQKLATGNTAEVFIIDLEHAGMPATNALKAFTRIKQRLQKTLKCPRVLLLCEPDNVKTAIECQTFGVTDIYVSPYTKDQFLARLAIMYCVKVQLASEHTASNNNNNKNNINIIPPSTSIASSDTSPLKHQQDSTNDSCCDKTSLIKPQGIEDYKNEISNLTKKIDTLLWKYLRPYKFSTIPAMSKVKETDDRIGIYDLDMVLGKGGFGTVRLGRNTETGQKVAIKQLSKEKLHNIEDLEAIEAEIKLMTILTHQNIVRLLGVEHTQSFIYIILEHLGGGDLRHFLCNAGSELKEDMIKKIFFQIASAIDYCHTRAIAHRDLKPENILFDDDGNAKLTDFGLSIKTTPGQLLKQYCGSPGYMAPEMLAGEAYDGCTADIYSLGIILMDLVIGPDNDMRLPEGKDQTAYDARTKKINEALQRPEFQRYSPSLLDLLARMVCIDKRQRISATHILKHPFLNGVAGSINSGNGKMVDKRLASLAPSPLKSIKSYNRNSRALVSPVNAPTPSGGRKRSFVRDAGSNGSPMTPGGSGGNGKHAEIQFDASLTTGHLLPQLNIISKPPK